MIEDGPLRLPFLRHPWPYPSGVCLFACLARVNVLRRHAVAALWLSGSAAAQLADQMNALPRQVGESRMAASLRLTASEFALGFDSTRWWPNALQSFAAPFANPLRFCPECLWEGYHTNLFQLPWWRKCPVHRSDLRSTCPHCSSPVIGIPLRGEPSHAFHCSGCNRDLANTGAIVMASRGGVTIHWHTVVAAHRQWTAAVSDAYVLAPILVSPFCEIEPQRVFDWIQAASVPWPLDLRPFVVEIPVAPRRGLRNLRTVPERCQLSALANLAAVIATPIDPDTVGDRTFCAASVPMSRALVRLERRLKQAAGGFCPHLWRDYVNNARQRLGERLIPELKDCQFPEAVGIRDRGYLRRNAAMSVTGKSNELTSLATHRSELAGLASFQLLCHLSDALSSMCDSDESAQARALIEWWYSHLMALTLVDGTIAATFAVAWIPPSSPDQILPGWPTIHLGRRAPGHSWVVAATYIRNEVTSYLMPIPTSRTIRSNLEQMCER